MADTYNDGGVVHGSQVVSINSVNYVAENITFEVPANFTERLDANGVPSGQFGRRGIGTGSMTLQLESSNTVLPPQFTVFALNQAAAGPNINVVVAKVGQAFDQNGETKVNIDIRGTAAGT